MTATARLPVNLSDRAADRIFELGLWPEFKAMLEHTKHSTPGLRSIAVSFDEQAGEGESSVLILAAVEEFNLSASGTADESTEWRWDRWAAETFSPDVLRHFCMMALPAEGPAANGR